MMRFLGVVSVCILTLGTHAMAQDISAGSRVTVNSDWHSKNGGPYSPKIVSCKSCSRISGSCIYSTPGAKGHFTI